LRSEIANSSPVIAGIKSGALGPQTGAEPPSANINLLCDFLANPFGNAEQARELLSQVVGRSVHDIELERGEFCFQIAFYFLACLAIAAHVDDPDLRKNCINGLYDRVRGYYGRTDVRVGFSDFIVAAPERDQLVGGLRELMEQAGEKHGDISQVVLTKLGIFDLVGVRRLHDYDGVLGAANFQQRFYLVAERLLLHFAGKISHPAVVAVISDMLSANYNILSKIVLAGLDPADSVAPELVDAPQTQPEEPLALLQLDPHMPDITHKEPSKVYLAGDYLLLLVENVRPIAGRGAIRFRCVLAVCDRRRKLPLCFVTLENSVSISNVFCVFEANGSHSNYGALQGADVLEEFIDKGMRLMKDRFDLDEIEEFSPPRQAQGSWWKLRRRSGEGMYAGQAA
jgi:hypothetical protein